MTDMPYFMSNEDWYYFDYEKKKYVLTDSAPRKAIDSYEAWYKAENSRYNGE